VAGAPAGVPAPTTSGGPPPTGGQVAMGTAPAGGGIGQVLNSPGAAAVAGVAGSLLAAFGTSAVRSIGTQMGRNISRGLFGSMTGSRR